tara:strand:- start:13 stop:258 length:246 start_codon:yes stop_codon:yes gene_type:complete
MKVVLVTKVKNWWDKEAKVTEHIVEGPDSDTVYAKCFREHFNRQKYANSTHTYFKDSAHKESYRKWISDVRNYANNGGDMW